MNVYLSIIKYADILASTYLEVRSSTIGMIPVASFW